jgi:uncharacterized membrane protein
MNHYKYYLTMLLAVFMIFAGIMHFVKPRFYNRFIPDFIPKLFANYLAGIIEVLLGIGLLIPQYQQIAGKGTLLLMIIFLPIHVLDFRKERPAIGSKKLAIIRLPIQFIFIVWAWYISS